MAGMTLRSGLVSLVDEADLRFAAAELPYDWKVVVELNPSGTLHFDVDGGRDGAWKMDFVPGGIPLAVAWIESLKPSPA